MSLRQFVKSIAKPRIEKQLERRNLKLVRTRNSYQSETSRCRARLSPFCIGQGLDIGPGGDPINETAVRVDLPAPYSTAGFQQPQLLGDATRLHWFADRTLDYVYSSHVLEDFQDTKSVLVEWLRVLRHGGNLVIFCPDEQVYRKHCTATGQPYNTMHVHADFGLSKVEKLLAEIGQTQTVHSIPLVDVYSFDLVAQKI